jgi:serine/threonine protein kinase
MNPSELIDLLYAVLSGEVTADVLFAEVDRPGALTADSAAALLAEIEGLYARNEIHFELYLRIKDQLTLARPGRATVPPPMPPLVTPAVTPRPESPAGATQLSNAPPADRTVLRAATRPPPRPVTRPPPAATPGRTGTPHTSPPPGPAYITGSHSYRSTQPNGEAPETMTWVIAQPLEPGTVVKSRFLLEQRLGEGGMGVVFKARDQRKEEAHDRDPYVAIKFLNAEFRRHPEALMALQREARRAQALAHPNIITVHDFDRDGALIYMTMEYLDGEPLDRFIQRHPQGLRFKEAWPIIEGCSRALAYAHEQGVIHADFKPGNVFVVGERRVKVLDFGIARAVQHHGADASHGTRFDAGSLGALTPAYASPEMLLGEQPDPRDDVYALACVSYELLAGRHPFNGATAVKAAHDGLQVKRTPGMSRRQHRALVRGLAFRQADRSKSVEAFLDEIAGPLGARGRSLRQALLSTTATAFIVAAIAGGAWWYTRTNPDEQLQRHLMEDAKVQAEELRRQQGGEAPELDPELRDLLLEQGREYLQMSAKQFDPALLSEGVSSAYGAFHSALAMDPSSKAAAEGIVEIVRQYEAEANRLFEAGQYGKAVEMAGYALKIQPTRESLESLKRDAEARLSTKGD